MKSSARPVRVAGRGPVTTQAFFGGFGGGVLKANGQPMICIDCGYIYRGDFDALPKDYKCPQCNVGKNRFKVVEQAGSSYANLAAQKNEWRKMRWLPRADPPRPHAILGETHREAVMRRAVAAHAAKRGAGAPRARPPRERKHVGARWQRTWQGRAGGWGSSAHSGWLARSGHPNAATQSTWPTQRGEPNAANPTRRT